MLTKIYIISIIDNNKNKYKMNNLRQSEEYVHIFENFSFPKMKRVMQSPDFFSIDVINNRSPVEQTSKVPKVLNPSEISLPPDRQQ